MNYRPWRQKSLASHARYITGEAIVSSLQRIKDLFSIGYIKKAQWFETELCLVAERLRLFIFFLNFYEQRRIQPYKICLMAEQQPKSLDKIVRIFHAEQGAKTLSQESLVNVLPNKC